MLEKYLEKYASCYNNENTKTLACKILLEETDYVVIKLYESVVKGNSINEMLVEYEEILNVREEARAMINELESEV